MRVERAPGGRPSADAAPVVAAPAVMPVVGRARAQLAYPLDGRYGAMDPVAMKSAVEWLARGIDLTAIDYVVGIPEGGYAPAYAFAAATGLPVIFATVFKPDVAGVVTFREAHDHPPLDLKHIYGLAPGDRVIVVEDEVTSGRTIVSCVRALRSAEVHCDQVATIYAADDAAMRARLAAEGVRLHVLAQFPADVGERLYR